MILILLVIHFLKRMILLSVLVLLISLIPALLPLSWTQHLWWLPMGHQKSAQQDSSFAVIHHCKRILTPTQFGNTSSTDIFFHPDKTQHQCCLVCRQNSHLLLVTVLLKHVLIYVGIRFYRHALIGLAVYSLCSLIFYFNDF